MKLSVGILLLAVLTSAACSPPGPGNDAGTDTAADVPPPDPTFANVQAILTRTCAVGETICHTTRPFTAGNLDLDAGHAYAQLVSVPSGQVPRLMRVDPGAVDVSYLVNKIEGTMSTVQECSLDRDRCGERMPMVSGITLTPSEVNLIKEWIRLGALEN